MINICDRCWNFSFFLSKVFYFVFVFTVFILLYNLINTCSSSYQIGHLVSRNEQDDTNNLYGGICFLNLQKVSNRNWINNYTNFNSKIAICYSTKWNQNVNQVSLKLCIKLFLEALYLLYQKVFYNMEYFGSLFTFLAFTILIGR